MCHDARKTTARANDDDDNDDSCRYGRDRYPGFVVSRLWFPATICNVPCGDGGPSPLNGSVSAIFAKTIRNFWGVFLTDRQHRPRTGATIVGILGKETVSSATEG